MCKILIVIKIEPGEHQGLDVAFRSGTRFKQTPLAKVETWGAPVVH